jgi:predicted small lipoprotein YifL
MAVRTLITVVLVATALAGCGRRGGLEPPGTQVDLAPPGAVEGPLVPSDVSPLDPGSVPATPEERVLQPPPRRRFFLDFIL